MTDDIPAAKVEACTTAMYHSALWSTFHARDEAEELVRITLRAAAAWDAEERKRIARESLEALEADLRAAGLMEDASKNVLAAEFQRGLRAGYDAALKEGRE